jgi:hypothetical protein
VMLTVAQTASEVTCHSSTKTPRAIL